MLVPHMWQDTVSQTDQLSLIILRMVSGLISKERMRIKIPIRLAA